MKKTPVTKQAPKAATKRSVSKKNRNIDADMDAVIKQYGDAFKKLADL